MIRCALLVIPVWLVVMPVRKDQGGAVLRMNNHVKSCSVRFIEQGGR